MPNIRQIINLIASRHLRPQPTALSILVDPLSRGEPVSFARYGDGEWEAILGHGGANCDGHSYTPLLGEALRHSLLHPKNYLYGIQPFACKCLGKKIARFIRENNVSIPWINADILHDANLEGRLLPFINALRKSHCIIIGPQHLRSLRLFPCAHFIEIPAKNCFDKHEQIMDEIRAYSQIRRGAVYLFSASMAANVMIHGLFDTVGRENSLLDIGSLWDIYCGVKSRGVYEDRDWTTIIRKNSGE